MFNHPSGGPSRDKGHKPRPNKPKANRFLNNNNNNDGKIIEIVFVGYCFSGIF